MKYRGEVKWHPGRGATIMDDPVEGGITFPYIAHSDVDYYAFNPVYINTRVGNYSTSEACWAKKHRLKCDSDLLLPPSCHQIFVH